MANIILFLGVADDPKVVGKLKCNVWFPLHNKGVTWTLSGHPNRFDVKYFLRYLCYIHIIIACFKIFFHDFSFLMYIVIGR